MPTKYYEQVKIWKSAHAYIKLVSEAYKAQGDSSMSMTALVSQACFSVPMPNGHQPVDRDPDCEEKEKPA